LLAAELAADAELRVGYVDLGGRLVRNDIDIVLRERGARVELFGLFVAGAGQHLDNHTTIVHTAPETRSDEAFRGIIGERGRGVFNGKVVVHPGAHGIDARQSNDNLLLSDQAEIDTKPELEIYSDDVKCAHGSTVGELDAEHLFYLRSRGVDEAQAREILTVAFAATVLERIAAPNLRDRITDKVVARLRAIAEAAR
jgi:Fe-S cluster assembly protein SufD